jgi:two-component system chemotaxis sensor kinase CheA
MKKANSKQALVDLGDVAARLMQLQSNETELLSALHDELSSVGRTRDPRVTRSVKKLVKAAAAKLDALLRGGASDPEQALAAAVQLVCLASSPVSEGLPEPAQPSADGNVPSSDIEPAPSADIEAAPSTVVEDKQSAQLEPSALLAAEPALLPDEPDLELIGEFLTEAADHVVAAEAALLTLERQPDDAAAVNTVFRAFHTVKGVASMLGLAALAELAHHAESLLSRIREGQIRCTGVYANLCLRGIDMLKATMQVVAARVKGQPAQLPPGYAELVAALQAPEASAQPAASAARAAAVPALTASAPTAPQAQPVSQLQSQPQLPVQPQTEESTVRVRTDRLDRLIDLVGELVIAQSMVAQDPRAGMSRDPELSRKVAHSGKIVRELQDMSMSLRMVPLRPTFQKLTRIVRDVAVKSGKQIQFVSTGDDTEIDRNMVDVIAEPLIHMVRNAADHGIEPSATRLTAGKAATGTVRIAAYHAGGSVVIDLSDDGAGLSRERILAKAIDRGLVAANANLSDAEVFQLIFLPGFSTAEAITDISGRGVGMDVVRRNIEQLKGRIEITSERGKGTVFSIHLPLTLAITDGMLVRVGSERYIIPTVSISMNFRPEASQVSTVSGRGEVILLRGELLPLFRLHQLFRLPNAVEDPTRALVVVLRDAAGSCGLLVDELLGQQQVVAKSLGEGIGKVPAVSGGAILGDGRVGLILDPASLVTLARQTRPHRLQAETVRKLAALEQPRVST